jgi:zinc protease
MRTTPFAVLALLVSALPAMAQDYTHPLEMRLPSSDFQRPDPMQHRVVLDNGLVAYVMEDHTVPLVTLTAFVRVGTADAAKPGAAQVLERALRSRNRAGTPLGDALREMAAEYRVNVSPEMTEISLNVPAADAWKALDLLAGILREPAVTDDDAAAVRAQSESAALPSARATGESGPVLYEGSLALALERFNALLLGSHPYSGQATAEQTRALTAADARAFHTRFFVPSNVVLAVAGDFSRDAAAARIRERFTDWSGASAPAFRRAAAVTTRTPRRIHTYPADKLQAWIVIGHELPPVPAQDRAALDVMNYILGGGHFDTRLFREIRDKRGLANTAGGFPEAGVRGPGSYTIRTYGRPEVVPLLLDITFREMERIRSEPVSDTELLVAKGALADGVYQLQFRGGHTTARTFAREWAERGDHQGTATYPERVRRVSIQDVRAAARKYLHPERMQIVLVGPIDKVRAAQPAEAAKRLEDFGVLVEGR